MTRRIDGILECFIAVPILDLLPTGKHIDRGADERKLIGDLCTVAVIALRHVTLSRPPNSFWQRKTEELGGSKSDRIFIFFHDNRYISPCVSAALPPSYVICPWPKRGLIRDLGIIFLSSVCKVFERFHGANNHRAREYSRSVAENFGKKDRKRFSIKAGGG